MKLLKKTAIVSFVSLMIILTQGLFLENMRQSKISAYIGNGTDLSRFIFKKYSIPDIVLEKIEKIRALVKRSKSIDISVGDNDLMVLIFDFMGGNGKEVAIKKSEYLMVFDEKEINGSGVNNVATKLMPKFLKGDTSNIKRIFWLEQKEAWSWSRGGKIKKEKQCSCDCVEGRFSFRLCVVDKCPIKKIKESGSF